MVVLLSNERAKKMLYIIYNQQLNKYFITIVINSTGNRLFLIQACRKNIKGVSQDSFAL